MEIDYERLREDMINYCYESGSSEMNNYGSAIRYMNSNKGVITGIFGIEEAKNVEGIVQVSVVHEIIQQPFLMFFVP